MAEFSKRVTELETRASDLVNSPTVQDGYRSGGHPAALAFQHLNTMASSRLRKAFPLFDRTDPLYRALFAESQLIVGEEILNKYRHRKEGEDYDYRKSIDRRFASLLQRLDSMINTVKGLEYKETHNG